MHLKMIVAPLATLAMTSSTFAACTVCDQMVTMNAKLAECFMAKYDDVVASLGDGDKLFTKVDLSSCGKPDDREKGFAGLPTPGGSPRRLKLVYLLDRAGADCIRADLSARTVPIDPLAEIDLRKCQ